ncbi:MAG: hypothetical protein ACXVCP_08155 [Bdellovibrio sp.]
MPYIRCLYLLCLFSIIPFYTEAATYSTATCEFNEVNSALQNASEGDTLKVAAGTCTWSSELAINKGITLMGAGIGVTTIIKNTGELISYVPSNPLLNSIIRISGFTFDFNGTGGTGIYVSSGNTYLLQTRLRIDHNRFQNILIDTPDATQHHYIVYADMRGVVDNNQFGEAFYPIRTPSSALIYYDSSGKRYFGGRAEWGYFEGIELGKADNNIYFEDNVFENLRSPVGDYGVAMTDCQEGQRYAFRYNNIHLSSPGAHLFDMHGNQSNSFYSCMGGEIYANQLTGQGGSLMDHRGGRAFVFFNYNADSDMSIQVREEFDDAISPFFYEGPAGGITYSQHVSGSYYFGNRTGATGNLMSAYINTTCSTCYQNGLQENTNFWQDNPQFNGTSGIGCGSLSSRPKTCTPGVGYWATNQSCSNLNGLVGKNPSTPLSGTFYRCVSADHWDQGVSPLPYPHPLRALTENGQQIVQLQAPKNLHVAMF